MIGATIIAVGVLTAGAIVAVCKLYPHISTLLK